MFNLTLTPTEASLEDDRRAEQLTVLVPLDVSWDSPADMADAIRRAAPLLRGQPATVVVTWRSVAPAAGMARAAMPAAAIAVGVRNWDHELRERAVECAQQLAAIAQESGLDARAEARLVSGPWHAAVAAVAADCGAQVIVLPHARGARRLARSLGRTRSSTLLLCPGDAPASRSEDDRSAPRSRRRFLRTTDGAARDPREDSPAWNT